MNKFSQAISRVLAGGATSFARYLASMISVLVVAVCLTIQTAMNYNADERIFGNLILAFGAGIFWGMALAVLSNSLFRGKAVFIVANLLSLLASGGLFYYLYQMNAALPEIVGVRIFASCVAALFIFLLVISRDADRSDYNQASFMVLKSLVISWIFTLVLFLGAMFIAFSVQSLLYKEMSQNVYTYISIWSSFFALAFFLGYFPRFSKDADDPRLETAQKHPVFIEILNAYVNLPIILLMSIVLLLWAATSALFGSWPDFALMSVIFLTYALYGVFMWMMVSHYEQGLAKFYRRFFPFMAIVFLGFEAYAWFRDVGQFGLRVGTYAVAVIWLFALFTMLMAIIGPVARVRWSAWVAIVLIVVSVLPIVGYKNLPVTSQVARLQSVLIKNDMLLGNEIVPASANISTEDKIVITDAALFLAANNDVPMAFWFTQSYDGKRNFADVFGFEQTYSDGSSQPIDQPVYLYLYAPTGYLDISDYNFAVDLPRIDAPIEIAGIAGLYSIDLTGLSYGAEPAFKVSRDGTVVIEQSLMVWADTLFEQYLNADGSTKGEVAFEDMTLTFEQNGVKMMILFDSVNAFAEIGGAKQYSFTVRGFYLAG